MAKLPVIKRLAPEDFPKEDRKLLDNLNLIIEGFYSALNGNLTFGENIAGRVMKVEIPKNTTISSSSPLLVPWGRANAPQAVWVGQMLEKGNEDGNALSTSAINVEWQYDSANKQIKVKAIHSSLSLPSSTKTYTLTLVGL